MRISRTRALQAMIPTASMADIAFLLIIFFMVTTVHELDRTSVNLPLAKIRLEADKGAAIVVLSKAVDESGARWVYKFSDGENMSQPVTSTEDIYLEATRLTFKNPQHQFVLKADGSARFEMVDELLDSMRKASVQKVLLLTAQQTEEGGT